MSATADDRITGLSSSVAIKAPVHAVTTANITLSGLQTIGGVVLDGTILYRVLVWKQTDPKQNGIYDATTGSWSRSKDFDGNRDVVSGTLVLTANGNNSYLLTTSNPITIGTSSLNFQSTTINITQATLGSVLYPQSAAEAAAGVTPVNYFYPPGNVLRYGTNTTPGTTDMTTPFVNCYAACKNSAGRVPMIIPEGTYLITSKLTWDGSVDVLGQGCENTILLKSGNIDCFQITTSGQQSRYQDFTVQATGTLGTGRGGLVSQAARLTMQRLQFIGHGGKGLALVASADTGFGATFSNISCVSNGDDGMFVDAHFFNCYFENLDLRSNSGWGFNAGLSTVNFHSGKLIVCQQNTSGGTQIGGAQNAFEIYCESNTGPDISLTASSIHNIITVLNGNSYPSDFVDLGTDNVILSTTGLPGVMTPRISRYKRTTNVAGLSVVVSGGAAGAGASPFAGGNASLIGGDADGTGNSNGGSANVQGGSGIGTGRDGTVHLQANNGPIVIGSSGEPANESICMQFDSTTKVPRMNKLTTAQRDALTLVNGMGPIFNTDTNTVQVTYGAAWHDI